MFESSFFCFLFFLYFFHTKSNSVGLYLDSIEKTLESNRIGTESQFVCFPRSLTKQHFTDLHHYHESGIHLFQSALKYKISSQEIQIP